MKTNLDEIYNEIDATYKSNGNFEDYNKKIDDEMADIDRRLNGYDKEIEAKNKIVNNLIEKASNEKDEGKKIGILEQVLKEKNKINTINKNKADLEKQKNKCKMRENNVIGYLKHKNEIQKIKSFKSKLEDKAKEIKEKFKAPKQEIKTIKSEIKGINIDIKNSKKEMDESKKVLKELEKDFAQIQSVYKKDMSDAEKEKCSQDLKNKNLEIVKAEGIFNQKEQAYKGLMQTKSEKIEKLNKLNETLERYNKELQNIKGMVGKCDLAWKTLFTDKDWDEIQRRSLENGKKYTKSKEENTKLENVKPEEAKEEEKIENVKPEEAKGKENQENKKEEKSMIEAKKPSFLKRITARIKNAYNSLKLYFSYDETEMSKAEISEKEVEETERQAEIERQEEIERQAEIERIKKQKENEKINQKDAFIEALKVKAQTEEITRNEVKINKPDPYRKYENEKDDMSR